MWDSPPVPVANFIDAYNKVRPYNQWMGDYLLTHILDLVWKGPANNTEKVWRCSRCGYMVMWDGFGLVVGGLMSCKEHAMRKALK
jgi:hypothetical protein